MKKKIIFGLMGFVSLVAASLANAATVSVNPASQTVAPGETFALTISGVDFLDGVTSASIGLTWDSSVMSLASTEVDVLFGGLLGFGFTDVFGWTAAPGSLELSPIVSQALPGVGLGGAAFDVVTLNFTAIAPPSTALSIGLSGIGGDWQDSNLNPVTGIIFNGASVTVSAVPVPAAVWLFGSGLLGLVGVARRRQVA